MKRVFLSAVLIIVLSTLSHAQWTMQASGFPNESTGAFYISIVDKDIVWISARDGLYAPYISNEFSRTVDGGVTWIPGQVIPGIAHYHIANITAISADTAWAGIYLDSTAQDHHCGIYQTINGGATWSQQFAVPDGATTFVNNVHFWNANEGIFLGDARDGYFEIYNTVNGGTTWTRVPQSDISATVPPPPGGEYGFVYSFDFVGDSMICFITDKTNFYISNDRGYHWEGKPTGINLPSNCMYKNVAFHDALHGLVGYASMNASMMIVHETFDGGDTWARVYSTGPINCLALEAVPGSPNTFVSTGQNAGMTDDVTAVNSGVTYSFDGGHTWTKMPTTDNKHFLDVKFKNDSVAYSGSWNNNPYNDGMYKFTSSLAQADFRASDSMINVGDQVSFSILSGGHSTSTFNWTFEEGTPPTSTSRNPVVTYNTKGVFTVKLDVTNSWGHSIKEKTAYIYAGCGVGIDQPHSNSVSVFPNPASDVLKITGSGAILNVRICDLTGRALIDQVAGENQVTLQTSGLKAGVYSLVIQFRDETLNRKIVIQ